VWIEDPHVFEVAEGLRPFVRGDRLFDGAQERLDEPADPVRPTDGRLCARLSATPVRSPVRSGIHDVVDGEPCSSRHLMLSHAIADAPAPRFDTRSPTRRASFEASSFLEDPGKDLEAGREVRAMGINPSSAFRSRRPTLRIRPLNQSAFGPWTDMRVSCRRRGTLPSIRRRTAVRCRHRRRDGERCGDVRHPPWWSPKSAAARIAPG